MKQKLYALLVGINKYPDPKIKNLYGCIRDVEDFNEFLGRDYVREQFAEINVKVLKNKEASKGEIIKYFTEYLGKARRQDVALFYFAGHGIREETNLKALKESELDGNIGTLVCEDSMAWPTDKSKNSCLSDKELRWLIGRLRQKCDNILTIFDCCHSGGNTRSTVAHSLPDHSRQVERRAIPARDWTAFCFHDQDGLTRDRFEEEHLSRLIPQGDHIQMAACRDIELAWEEPKGKLSQRKGVFTKALLDVLEAYRAKISYRELHQRILHQMQSEGQRAQSPQIYYPGKDSTTLQRLFLTNKISDVASDCSVFYNKASKEWRLGIGALHGASPSLDNLPPTITVKRSEAPDQSWPGKIETVYLNYCVFKFTGAEPPQSFKYRAKIKGLSIEPIAVSLEGPKTIVDQIQKGLNELIEKERLNVFFEIIEKDGSFILAVEEDKLVLYAQASGRRPLLLPIRILDDNKQLVSSKILSVYNDLQQIAKWRYLKDLNFKNFSAPPDFEPKRYPLELKVFQLTPDGMERQLNIDRGNFQLEPTHGVDGISWDTPREEIVALSQKTQDFYTPLRFEVVSHYREGGSEHEKKGLCFSLLYQDCGFGVDTLFDQEVSSLEQPVLWIKEGEVVKFPNNHIPGATIAKNGKAYYQIFLNEHIYRDNWPGLEEYFKLIVSTRQFEVRDILMKPIKLPYDEEDTSPGIVKSKGVEEEKQPKNPWEIKTAGFYLANPLYLPEA